MDKPMSISQAYPNLPNAPITEAIIDIGVNLPEGSTVERLRSMKADLQSDYPLFQNINVSQHEFKFSNEGLVTQGEGHKLIGYKFQSMERNEVVQAKLNGFTFNKLKPYSSWDEIFPIAMELWAQYINCISPESVTRVATRFINQFKIQRLPYNNLDEYLVSPPAIPESVPENVIDYFSRVVSFDAESGAGVTVTQSIGKCDEPDFLSIIFDIDTYMNVGLHPNDEAIDAKLNTLHEVKNRIFFNNFTETTIRRFQ